MRSSRNNYGKDTNKWTCEEVKKSYMNECIDGFLTMFFTRFITEKGEIFRFHDYFTQITI